MHFRGVRSAINIVAVGNSVVKDPELLIRRRLHLLGLSYGSF